MKILMLLIILNLVRIHLKKKIYLCNTCSIPGFFKDETAGVLIVEFVGLRAKMYSILMENANVKDAAKGVDAYVKEHCLSHEDYKESLFNDVVQRRVICRIAQEDHILHTVESEKVCLRSYNDKKYITRDGNEFTSYSFGHYHINRMQELEQMSEYIDQLDEDW